MSLALPAFVEQGHGDTAVLLLHGIGGGKAIWRHTLPALAQAGYRAVALDFPGYGDSAGTPTLDAMAGAVAALIAALQAPRTVLVGHSMGGMVAQELLALQPVRQAAQQAVQQAARQAVQQPVRQAALQPVHQPAQAPRVHGLVLACTSASFGKADGAWQARFIAERLAPLDAGLGMAGVAQRLVPAMVAPAATAAARDAAVAVMSQVPESAYRTALTAIAAFDRRDALARIAVPTLCLAAAHDRTAPPDVMQRMAQRIPAAQFKCLPEAGHIANVEQPAAFNAALLAFLRRHFGPLEPGA